MRLCNICNYHFVPSWHYLDIEQRSVKALMNLLLLTLIAGPALIQIRNLVTRKTARAKARR